MLHHVHVLIKIIYYALVFAVSSLFTIYMVNISLMACVMHTSISYCTKMMDNLLLHIIITVARVPAGS